MNTKYTIEEIEEMREYIIKLRNKNLGVDFDSEGAVTLSHITALLAEVLQYQKSKDMIGS